VDHCFHSRAPLCRGPEGPQAEGHAPSPGMGARRLPREGEGCPGGCRRVTLGGSRQQAAA